MNRNNNIIKVGQPKNVAELTRLAQQYMQTAEKYYSECWQTTASKQSAIFDSWGNIRKEIAQLSKAIETSPLPTELCDEILTLTIKMYEVTDVIEVFFQNTSYLREAEEMATKAIALIHTANRIVNNKNMLNPE